MKDFRGAVKRKMEREGWKVSLIDNGSEIKIVQLHCIRRGKERYIRVVGNGHGHVYKWILNGLKEFEKMKKAPVIVAKVNGENEIIFLRLEKFLTHRNEKKETSKFTFKEPRELGFVAHQDGEFIKGGRKW